MGILSSLFARPRRERRATIENPAVSLNDPNDWDAFGVVPSSAGIHVVRETALTHSPVWRAVSLISGDVARIPTLVYRVEGKARFRDASHKAYYILRRKANSEMTAYTWKRMAMTQALLCPGHYSFIFRDEFGNPQELVPLDPDATYPLRVNGALWYVTTVEGKERKLYPEDVFHIKGMSLDGLLGLDPIEKGRETIGQGMAALKFGSIFFRNNARPNIVLESPVKLDDVDISRLRDSWERMHSGLDNAHRAAVLEEGMTAHELSINAVDSQLIETRKLNIVEVANFYDLPPHKLGDSSRTSYKSLEQENQAYLDECLDRWFSNIEAEAWDKLLMPSEKKSDSHEIEFYRRGLVRADQDARGKYYTAALASGWMRRNEVRSEEGLNPIPGGDEVFTPTNVTVGPEGIDHSADGDKPPEENP